MSVGMSGVFARGYGVNVGMSGVTWRVCDVSEGMSGVSGRGLRCECRHARGVWEGVKM